VSARDDLFATDSIPTRARRRRRHVILAGAALAVVGVAMAILVAVLAHPGRTPERPERATSHSTGTPATPAQESVSLEGTWVVTALVDGNGHPALPQQGGRVRITFHDGKLTADIGCNEVSGTYEKSGHLLHIPSSSMSVTLVGCGPEAPLASRLLVVRSVARDQGGTYLEDASGKVVVALARA
jgi:heat shock protein HslJ